LLFIILGPLEFILLVVALLLIKQMRQFILELKFLPELILLLIVILKQSELINLKQLTFKFKYVEELF